MSYNEVEIEMKNSPSSKRGVTINGVHYEVSEDAACIVHAIMCLERTVVEYMP